MIELLIENQQDILNITPKTEELIKSVCEEALSSEGWDFDAQISITFTDNETIKKINSYHRKIDKATDVLSFPLLIFDEDMEILEAEYDGDMIVLGDIVISTEQALIQAEKYGHSIKREIAFLIAHSMLHLLGYDHELGDEDEKIMFSKQKNILEKLNITREDK